MRPVGSVVRRRIATILDALKVAHGYEIYKHYLNFFPKTSLRNIYYNLRKGAQLGEFIVVSIDKVPGNYSWGGEAERVYYTLGPLAEPINIVEVYATLRPREVEVDWRKELTNILKNLAAAIEKAKTFEEKRKIIKRIEDRLETITKWCRKKGIDFEEVLRETPLYFMWKEEKEGKS